VTATTDDAVAELSIRADATEVSRASAWLEKTGLEHGVPAEQISHLDQCLNEALANIITHGGPAARSSPIRLSLYVHCDAGSGQAAVTVSDSGIAFNPLAYRQKPGPQTLAETEPGGLGIVMMHGYADDIRYRYGEGRNHLTFRVLWIQGG